MNIDSLKAALSGRYLIERELGAGGMATVFLAEDLKHQRKVAIKILKPELAAVLGAERFVQEITTTAQLQHPHILPLFDSGESGGLLWYVMPYIEGETLRDKLNRETQLGVDEAVRITREVADALDYAHRHGVVHRDIKPENILLHDGRPMVADFGIALAVSAAAGGRMTETGLSLGTPHYMSPEQATADKEITGRSDIYSIASVCYEMLTGNPPHTGSSAQQIIMKIVAEEAQPVTRYRKSVPDNVAAALAKGLEKLPADRFGTAKEFADALVNPGFTTAATSAAGLGAVARAASGPVVAVLGVALVAALGFAAVQWRAAHRDQPEPMIRFAIPRSASILVNNQASGTNVAVSPDGQTIAYSVVDRDGTVRLAIRPISDADARILAGTDGAQQPAFSPDGREIAYLVGNVAWRVALDGGAPTLIGNVGMGGAIGLTWAANGSILTSLTTGIVALPAAGGQARLIVAPDTAGGDIYFEQPRALPDGDHVLFGIQPTGGVTQVTLGILSLQTDAITRVDLPIRDPIGMINDALVYVTPAGALSAVRLDVAKGTLTSNPVPLGADVLTSIAGASEAAMSPNGTLVYQQAHTAAWVGWVDPQGRFTPILPDSQVYAFPRLSPDGRRFAMAIGGGGASDIWIYDIASATPTRLTNTEVLNDRPEWTPDGQRLLFRSTRVSRTGLWWQPVDMSSVATPLQADDRHQYYEGVISPDGTTLAYQVDDGGAHQADIEVRALSGDTTARPFAASPFIEAQARFSPDGRWIAFVSDASGTDQVFVQPFPGPGPRIQVSTGRGSEPVWSRDGRRIFYRDGRNLMAATVATTGRVTVTGRTALFPDDFMFAQAPHANYDVSLDGTRFLMVKSAETPQLEVVYGFANEVRRQIARAGAAR
jgi:serine/threonine-protein kinase